MAKKKPGGRGTRSLRGSGEAFTGAKEGQVEVRKASIGDNSGLALVAPNDYEHHLKTIKGLKEKAATANSMVRHAKTAANKLKPGLAASIEETIAIERENDPVKLQTRLNLLGLGLKVLGHSVQLTVFDTLAGDQEELVAKRGYEDGKSGRTPDNKYPDGSDLALLYDTNWKKGQAELLGVKLEDGGEGGDGANSANADQQQAAA